MTRFIDAYDAAMFDLDGVVYLGPRAVEGSPESLGELRKLGVKVGFVTNNAGRSADVVVDHLNVLGIECHRADVVTSPQAIAQAATGIQHLGPRRQRQLCCQPLQRPGRRGKNRRIAPGIQGIDQQQAAQQQQPAPARQATRHQHRKRQRKPRRNPAPPPPGTAPQAGTGTEHHRQTSGGPPRQPALPTDKQQPSATPNQQRGQRPDQGQHPALPKRGFHR